MPTPFTTNHPKKNASSGITLFGKKTLDVRSSRKQQGSFFINPHGFFKPTHKNVILGVLLKKNYLLLVSKLYSCIRNSLLGGFGPPNLYTAGNEVDPLLLDDSIVTMVQLLHKLEPKRSRNSEMQRAYLDRSHASTIGHVIRSCSIFDINKI